jgi:hypothetical protein
MSLQPLIQFIVAPLLASVAAMTYAAAHTDHLISRLSAALFFVAVSAVAYYINKPYWPAPRAGTEPSALFHTMRRNTRLAALTYAWAAAAFFAIYGLSGLEWRHGFQYGTGAALFAAGLLAYVHWMGKSGKEEAPPPLLNVIHMSAVMTALVFLIFSGKLQSTKGDWAANNIFLYGALTLLVLCTIARYTENAFAKQARQT